MSVPRTDTESGYELLFIIYSRHLSTECSDFRTISLLGHAAKVLIRVKKCDKPYWERSEVLRWEGFVEKVGFEPGVKE